MDRLTPDQRSQLMAKIKGKDTTPELAVRSALHQLGYRYRLHAKDLPGSPDLVFPKLGKILFVHGCFWHGHDCKWGRSVPKSNVEFWVEKIRRNQKRDALALRRLRAQGWSVATVWECKIARGRWLPRTLTFLRS